MLDAARDALHFIPPDIDRDAWLRAAMGFKDAGGTFKEFDAWSRTASNYKQSDCKALWNSIKPGGVTVATLFHDAKLYGYSHSREVRADHLECSHSSRRVISGSITESVDSKNAAKRAGRILDKCYLAAPDHPYLVKKRIKPPLIPWVDSTNRLIIPVMDLQGDLHSLQAIAPDGAKKFLPSGIIKNNFYQLWTGSSGTLVVCEGYATGVTLLEHYVSDCSVFVAFNAGNILPVAKVLRGAFPENEIVIAGDCDASGVGQKKAEEAARAVNGSYTIPVFMEHESGSDFNDRYCQDKQEVS